MSDPTAPPEAPFWETTPLDAMTDAQWEALCDGCARCCLHKLEDEDTGEVYTTDVACRLLDLGACRCGAYAARTEHVPGCLDLRRAPRAAFGWLPRSCAYRRLSEGRPLAWWHPLRSGSPDTVHSAGVSVRGWAVAEADVDLADLVDRVVDVADLNALPGDADDVDAPSVPSA